MVCGTIVSIPEYLILIMCLHDKIFLGNVIITL